jgi:8-oxo-dGTP pyrophosphatase MutT (NUDIX family)
MNDLPDPIPAATVILMRPAPAGPPEILMMERVKTMAFAGGALVFPGGRIDPDDVALAERIGGGFDFAAARIAAIRETIEETGIAPGLSAVPDAATISQMRQELEEGAPFSALLDALGPRPPPRRAHPLRPLVPDLQGSAAVRHHLLRRRAPGGIASAAEAEAVRTLWATASRCSRKRIRAGADHLPDAAQSGAAGALRLDRGSARRCRAARGAQGGAVDRGAGRHELALHTRRISAIR